MNDNHALAHYGVRGMHWGIRNSKSKTGISRARGATIDRHNRQIARITAARSGATHKNFVKVGRAFVGEKQQNANWDKMLHDLKSSNSRIKSGQLTTLDKLDVWGNTSLSGLFISRTPAKQAQVDYSGKNQILTPANM